MDKTEAICASCSNSLSVKPGDNCNNPRHLNNLKRDTKDEETSESRAETCTACGKVDNPNCLSVLHTINAYRRDDDNERGFQEAERALQLCERLKAIREYRGLTQAQLAKRLDVTQPFIAKLERGGYAYTQIDTLSRVLAALDYRLRLEFEDLTIPPMEKPA